MVRILQATLATLVVVVVLCFLAHLETVSCMEHNTSIVNCTGSISAETYDAIESLYNSTVGWQWRWDPQQPASTIWQFPCELDTPCSSGWQGLQCVDNEEGSGCEIRSLLLNFRNLNGKIPSQLSNLQKLEVLFLNGNSLYGSIPSELGTLENLEELDVFGNLLAGAIPSELGNLLNLEELYLNDNCFVGSIPSELGYLVNLVELYLYENSLSGTIPQQLGDLVNLEALFLEDNSLAGTIPFELSNLVKLESIGLDNNLLTGVFELLLFDWPHLLDLNVSSNELSGSIEVSVAGSSLQNLTVLDMSNNHFVGTLSDTMFLLPSLQTIILSQNCFSGSLPYSLCQNHNLENIMLDLLTGNCARSRTSSVFRGFVLRQYMDGTVPACVWNSSTIRTLHLLGNGLLGSLEDLADASALSVLALGSNQLIGTVPKSFQFHNFTQLDLSINRLTGTLESGLVISNTTQSYDLSVNRLSGRIPSSLYQSFSSGVINVLEGNLFGCQPYNKPSADGDSADYQCGSVDFEYSLLTWILGVMLAIFAAVLTITWCRVGIQSRHMRAARSSTLMAVLVGPSRFLAVSAVGLVVVVASKLTETNQGSSTHAIQYWWTSTVAFVHNWFLFSLLFFTLLACCVTFTSIVISFQRKCTILSGRSIKLDDAVGLTNVSNVQTVRAVLAIFCAHCVNIIVVSVVNGIYVLVAVDDVTNFALLSVQATLGIFKLSWSVWAIPRLLSWTMNDSLQQSAHWIFMVLFIFLGAPFVSTFCESSSCFLYVLVSPTPISSSVVIPTVQFVSGCTALGCAFYEVTVDQTIWTTILPPWIYSFQCSSSVVTSYAPVLILSYLVSGILIPFTLLALANKLRHLSGWARSVLLLMFEMTYTEKSSAIVLLENNAVARLGRKMTVKYIQNLAVMMTFGLAVPLLSIAVICDTALNLTASIILLEQFIEGCEDNGLDASNTKTAFWDSFGLLPTEIRGCCFIVLGYVSVFWSLFAFDWIGDVEGPWAGGVAMLVPLLMPTMVGIVLLMKRKLAQQQLFDPQNDTDQIEMAKVESPLGYPQVTNDEFVVISQ
jgi:hypothetical protein